MKSDGKIKTDIYEVIQNSELELSTSGILTKTERPADSDKEDIVISILDNGSGGIQEARVSVNIYVPDIHDSHTDSYIIDEARVDELCELAIDLLESYTGDNFRFTIEKQRVFKSESANEHFINNQIFYKQFNY